MIAESRSHIDKIVFNYTTICVLALNIRFQPIFLAHSLFATGILAAGCMFMLWTRHLVIVYMYIVSIGLIFLSYWSNLSAIGALANQPCILEDILSLNYAHLLNPKGECGGACFG